MSKLSDYSKFDHLDEEEDDMDDGFISNDSVSRNNGSRLPENASESSQSATTEPNMATQQHVKESSKGSDIQRFVVSFQGRTVYEWEQTLDSVTLFVPAPPFVNDSKLVICHIAAKHLQLGLLNHLNDPSSRQQQWYLDEDTYGKVDTHESCWSLEDNDDDDDDTNRTLTKMIVIYLTKAHLGELWEAALLGNRQLPQNDESSSTPATGTVSMDPWSKQEIQKQLMLERFQQEHPGMDFRGASFNGSVPDPRTFLGGIHHK